MPHHSLSNTLLLTSATLSLSWGPQSPHLYNGVVGNIETVSGWAQMLHCYRGEGCGLDDGVPLSLTEKLGSGASGQRETIWLLG